MQMLYQSDNEVALILFWFGLVCVLFWFFPQLGSWRLFCFNLCPLALIFSLGTSVESLALSLWLPTNWYQKAAVYSSTKFFFISSYKKTTKTNKKTQNPNQQFPVKQDNIP